LQREPQSIAGGREKVPGHPSDARVRDAAAEKLRPEKLGKPVDRKL